MQEIKIKTIFIKLGQFLKLANIVSSGCEAKTFLVENQILVNDEIENRRGRKLYVGDQVFFNNQKFVILKEHTNER